ncbi:MAG: cytochrome c3 family protein [Acidobacteriaceae bacterium]|nr:cytochrome c3 family protein [Acidobacteriaceae bacterium]
MILALAGSSACAACHKVEYTSQIETSMAHAMEPVAGCIILKQHAVLTFRDGVYHYRIERQGDQSLYSVTDGKNTVTVPLEYAFGLGKAGQTYVFELDGKMYESRVSFYAALNGLDLTTGAANLQPGNLREAAGRLMDRRGAEDCFGCHSTSATREHLQNPESLTPGVTCEHCHGSALAHVEGFRQGKPAAMKNLSALTTEELSDFCGQCHRTWAQIAADGPHDINNVRFQPYRLANSKCYDPSDKRISCVVCHNVHQEVVGSDSFYDRKCLACHASAKHCAVSTQNCVSCHMPKLELPGAHYKFTDHQIRIVRANASYPP